MPRGRKAVAAKTGKNDSMRQISLMKFVKPTTLTATSAEPGTSTGAGSPEPASPESNTSIIFGTPQASIDPIKGFTSSTGDFVQLPPTKRPRPSARLHRKPRRSSLVTQRRILVMAKRAAEGRTDPVSREGDYDGLNYAPIHQVTPGDSSPFTTIAGQRARKMVRMVVSQALQKKTSQTKQVSESVIGTSMDRSAVFEDGTEAAPQLEKGRQPLALESQELHFLDEAFTDFADSVRSPKRVSESKVSSNVKRKTLGKSSVETVLLESSFIDALDEEWGNGFDNQTELKMQVPSTPEVEKQPWYRCRVTEVTTSGHSKIVSTICLDAHASPTIHLSGSWRDTPLQVGDIINLIPSSIGTKSTNISPFSTWILSDDPLPSDVTTPPLLVLHPEILISGTTVAAAARGCVRRAVLQHFWDEDEAISSVTGSDSDSTASTSLSGGGVMLVGSLVHRAFQQVVRQQMSGNPSTPQAALFHDLIAPSTILQLYAMGDSIEKLCESLKFFLPKINQWVKRHCGVNSSSSFASPGVADTPVIKEVFDIEENIWCTKFGVKGKIDMTVFCSTNSQAPTFLIPLELKTGKPTFSFEHQGQVLLYLLMLADRHADRIANVSNYGWLVYLRQMDRSDVSGLVKPKANSFRGLIQTRNHLAASLRNLTSREALIVEGEEAKVRELPIPPPLDRERVCSWCPYLLTCGMLRGQSTPPHSDAPVRHLFEGRVKHVEASYKSFLYHWLRLQLLEHASTNRVDKVLVQIAEESNVEEEEGNRVKSGSGIRGLVIQDIIKLNHEQKFSFRLRRYDNGPISIHGLSVGDFVIVSSDNGRHVGLCLATFTTSSAKFNTLTITTDRPLPLWITRFRLDRYVSDRNTHTNLSNLMKLMENSKLCSRLRQLIIDQTCPRFTKSLRKTTLLQIRKLLRPLNIYQRCAILSVLMSKDYTLIEGFPGSGKTETLAVLLHCLTVLGKKTLLISHTHSAVDNVLLRLLRNSEIKFVRLGACERVDQLLHSHSLEKQLSEEVSKASSRADWNKATTECTRLVKFVDEVMARATIVGCTALAAGSHEALARCQFDVVVVDEATQLLLPTTLGGLLKLNPDSGKFILVGDANQLPPLVHSNVARKGGLDTSLFALLFPVVQPSEGTQAPEEIDSMESCLVKLKAQYRMNSQILHLANTLFYGGRMQCASDEVANRTLKLLKDAGKPKEWLARVLSPHLADSVILLDTQNICGRANSPFDTNVNNKEVEVVRQILANLTQRGMEADEIGVIAPYRAQVDALRRCLDGKSSANDNNGSDCCPLGMVEVNTADQFQGRDKSVIIVSFVDCLLFQSEHINDASRSSSSLLNERPRLNVALTRAKQKLVLIGCGGIHSRSCGASQQTPTVLEEMLTVLRQMSAVVPIPSTYTLC